MAEEIVIPTLGCTVEKLYPFGRCDDCKKRPATRYLRWYDMTGGLDAEIITCGICLRSREAEQRRFEKLISEASRHMS